MTKNNEQPEQQSHLEKENTRLLIEKKALETKLEVSETRLRFILVFGAAFLTFFGAVLPMWLTNRSADKVDRAIDRMEARFEKLAGHQLRKPDIECYLEGKGLGGSVLEIRELDDKSFIQVKNTGDRIASTLQVALLTKKDVGLYIGGNFGAWAVSDVPGFDYVYRYRAAEHGVGLMPLNPGDFAQIEFRPRTSAIPQLETEAILKIYYGEPEPKIFRFTIKLGKQQ